MPPSDWSHSPLIAPRPSTPPTPHRNNSYRQHTAAHHSQGSQHQSAYHNTSNITMGLFSQQQQQQQQQQTEQQRIQSMPTTAAAFGWGAPAPSSTPSSTDQPLGSSNQVHWGSTPAPLPASVQWGSGSSLMPPASSSASASSHNPYRYTPPQPVPDRTRKTESKRKRWEDEDEDEDMAGLSLRSSPSTEVSSAGQGDSGMPARHLVPKRIRAGLGTPGLGNIDEGVDLTQHTVAPWRSPSTVRRAPSSAFDSLSTPVTETRANIDIGKMLASLEKPQLLTLLDSLMSANPSLTPALQSLLPLPTLEYINSSLDTHEQSIKAALPFGTESARPEYIWSRLRGPLSEFVNAVQGWIDFFREREQEQAISVIPATQAAHPSTMFALLHAVTAEAIKIQLELLPPLLNSPPASSQPLGSVSPTSTSSLFLSSLPLAVLAPSCPNGILTTLFPLLLDSWDALLSRISADINTQGRMFGREVVTSWLRGIEDLKPTYTPGGNQEKMEPERALVLAGIQKCLDHIDATLKREIGWVVGVYA